MSIEKLRQISTKAKVGSGLTIAAFTLSGCAPIFTPEQKHTPSPTEPIAKEASKVPTPKFDQGEAEPFDGTIVVPEEWSEWRMVEEDYELVGSYPGTFDGWVDMESIPVDEREEGVHWGLWSNSEGRGRVRFVRVEESEKTQEPTIPPKPEEIVEKAWEAYSKDEALLSKPVTVKFQEVASFDDRIRLIAKNPWYFGELPSKVAEIVQRPEMESPYNYKDLEDIYGGFAFHPSNEDGFVVFYTLPEGAQVKGVLSCDSALTPGLKLAGVSEGQGLLYPQDYYFEYKNPMKVEVLIPLPEEGASEVVPVTVPAGAYLMPTDFWSITSDKREFLPKDLYKIPEEPFQCASAGGK